MAVRGGYQRKLGFSGRAGDGRGPRSEARGGIPLVDAAVNQLQNKELAKVVKLPDPGQQCHRSRSRTGRAPGAQAPRACAPAKVYKADVTSNVNLIGRCGRTGRRYCGGRRGRGDDGVCAAGQYLLNLKLVCEAGIGNTPWIT